MVVVGATSGIGRATARAFAERGDRLVLAARATTTLAEVRGECAAVDVLTVPTDVTGLSGRSVAAHDGSVFAPNPAGEAVRGGHLPDLRQLVHHVSGPVGACYADGSADLFGTVRDRDRGHRASINSPRVVGQQALWRTTMGETIDHATEP